MPGGAPPGGLGGSRAFGCSGTGERLVRCNRRATQNPDYGKKIPHPACKTRLAITSAFSISQAQSIMEFFLSGSMAKVLTLLTVVGILMLRPQVLFALKLRK